MNYKGGNKIIYQDSKITKLLIESKKYGQHIFTVDTKNYDKIKDCTWCVKYEKEKQRFAKIVARKNNKLIILHQFLTNKKWIDHIDCNIFNNLESNYRECTHIENMRNRGKPKTNTSGFKGVSWNKNAKKWSAKIKANDKSIHLGYFIDKIQAAKAYNFGAVKYFGEFAWLNRI